jgi:hypothetical protein
MVNKRAKSNRHNNAPANISDLLEPTVADSPSKIAESSDLVAPSGIAKSSESNTRDQPDLQNSTQTGVEDQNNQEHSNSPDMRDDNFISLLRQSPGK